VSITSEELDKQIADFISNGGSIKEACDKPKKTKTFTRFEVGEFNQVVEFVKRSSTPVLMTDIAKYLDFSKSKVRSILDRAESKGILSHVICTRHKVKLWSVAE